MNYQNQQYNTSTMFNGGDTGGTPIELLRNDLKSSDNKKDNESHYTVGSIDTTTDIRNLVDEINTNIEKKQQITKNNEDTESEKNKKNKKGNKKEKKEKKNKQNINKNKIIVKTKQKNICNTWEDYLYDFILLFIIFMLMSQDFVKNFIGSKIKIINVNEKGVVPLSGVVVYGFIFVTIFICMKILINSVTNNLLL